MEKVPWNSINKNQSGFEQSNTEESSTLPRMLHLEIVHFNQV